jgi:catecholate siderophore receptor
VIRGVDSSANFFVDGFRDDVQYYRDIYNTQSVEVLKGPSALVFGRGAGVAVSSLARFRPSSKASRPL